jgi:1-deoxy-D-xylulose-5-phosphate reductoisomerase
LKRIAILGSTGSIGTSTIEIVKRSRDDFRVVALSAGSNIELLREQLGLFPDALFAVGDREGLDRILLIDPSLRDRAVGYGDRGLYDIVGSTSPELVVNSLVGVAGLVPTMRAIEGGSSIALANKESIVTAGALVTEAARRAGVEIIPVDSEHFSLSRCLRGYAGETAEIILTASGGPFFGRKLSELSEVTVEEVLDHPTWKMGQKVTVDSAHLLNKGLEVIEAHHLFGFPYEEIRVIIHPQSIVHSLLRLRDGSLLAHLGPADMRLPLMNALYYPRMEEFPWGKLDLIEAGTLEFRELELARFPAYRLALEAAREGGTAPAVLNAADETAVNAFLAGKIGFLAIIDWIEEALGAHETTPLGGIEDVLEADRWTREFLSERHTEATLK